MSAHAHSTISNLSSFLKATCARQNPVQHRPNYLTQDEFVVVEDFLPSDVVSKDAIARFGFKGMFARRSRSTPKRPVRS